MVAVAGSKSARLTSPRSSITKDLLPALIFSAPVNAPLVSGAGAKAITTAPCYVRYDRCVMLGLSIRLGCQIKVRYVRARQIRCVRLSMKSYYVGWVDVL